MIPPRHRRTALGCLAAILAAGCPHPSPAQSTGTGAAPAQHDTFGRTRLTFFAGGSLRDSRRSLVVNDELLHAVLEQSPSFGARMTRDIAGPAALDVSYRFSPAHLSLEGAGSAARIPVAIHQVSANALVYLCGSRCELRPFLTAGADFNGYFPGDVSQVPPSLSATWSGRRELPPYYQPGFNFGGGFEAVFHRRFAFRFELRDHLSRFPSFGLPAAPGTPGAAYFPPQPRLHDVEISVGAVLRFR